MSENDPDRAAPSAAPIPRTFLEYIASFGPGLVIVLTWLGAGDIVDMGVAGANYGYSLMWMLVLAIFMRFLFVSLIAKYQLCNQRGEGVLDGLARIHPLAAPLLLAAAVIMVHVYESYMTLGAGKVCHELTGRGEVWHWAVLCNLTALVLVFQPVYQRLEMVFKFFLALLTVSLVGSALWVGFNLQGVAAGLLPLELPKQSGKFSPMLVAVAMLGTIGGSIMNLAYPYFLEAKGWRGPAYRRLQIYDLLFAVAMMIVLNLAVWTLGAELLYPDQRIEKMEDLPNLLAHVLGDGGRVLFYLGMFAAVYTSVIGHAAGLAYLGSHAYERWRQGDGPITSDLRQHWVYRGIVVWALVSPLPYAIQGVDFVTLTLISNSFQVVLMPLLAVGVWWITASSRFIGPEHRNRWWENAFMTIWFGFSLFGAWHSVQIIRGHFGG